MKKMLKWIIMIPAIGVAVLFLWNLYLESSNKNYYESDIYDFFNRHS